ncbi:MAG: GspE/PulE family protein [Candidatus Moranbacteria bacterium]|nr:GspE/PulE family protein [Candidatus Moranbacteria bacterium]
MAKKADSTAVAEKITDIALQAKGLGVRFLEEAPANISKKTLAILPEDSARKYNMVPFQKEGDSVFVAMVNPQDFEALNVLRFLAEKERIRIEVYLVSEKVFIDIIKGYTGTDRVLKEAILALKKDDNSALRQVEETKKPAEASIFQDAPIAKLVEVIVQHAIDARASDIHIEPIDGTYRVRFRVDGLLRADLVFPKEVGRAAISRIKILSDLKIDENRKPQDGRFRFESESGFVDLRVSSLPVMEGEKIVMRVLEKNSDVGDLEKLGMWGRNRAIIEAKIQEPFGIILITGPTGSGKSTSLYAFLQILNKEDRNIITLEDPVEYNMEGVNQSQVRPEIGYTFANGLRSILRQDPNVIMVGEIRDSETAELAIHAALTGHLVFSTLHTNDAIGAIPRLVDMGIEPFLLSSSLEAVAAQRLVRRICEFCKEEFVLTDIQRQRIVALLDTIPDAEIVAYGLKRDNKLVIYQGKGCEKCGMSGYRGRIALYETIDVDDTMSRIIADQKGNEGAVQEAALKQGMLSMKQDGLLKALKAITSLAEVERVTEGTILLDEEDEE